MDYGQIIHLTADAWFEVGDRVFQSAWVVCGYFNPYHFAHISGLSVAPIESVGIAKHLLEPSGVLEGTTLVGTPQFCKTYEWRIED